MTLVAARSHKKVRREMIILQMNRKMLFCITVVSVSKTG